MFYLTPIDLCTVLFKWDGTEGFSKLFCTSASERTLSHIASIFDLGNLLLCRAVLNNTHDNCGTAVVMDDYA